jgi:hypothetical protein
MYKILKISTKAEPRTLLCAAITFARSAGASPSCGACHKAYQESNNFLIKRGEMGNESAPA